MSRKLILCLLTLGLMAIAFSASANFTYNYPDSVLTNFGAYGGACASTGPGCTEQYTQSPYPGSSLYCVWSGYDRYCVYFTDYNF